MAEEMQGIMGLMESQGPEETGQIDLSQFSPEIEGYARANPRQFNKDILDGIAEADPALAQQFVAALSSMQLPPDIIDALQLMVDEILADPENYAEDRLELIKEGVPAEILPEEFDPAYFAALNIALDQLDTTSEDMQGSEMVPRFAEGGIINAKIIAKELAAMGRNGDTMLAHITPSEARMLRRRGGSGTINPETGLPEYFIKKAFRAVKKAFKGVGKAVKGVVKGIGNVVKNISKSAIGKMALTFASVYFMGPAGFGLSGKLGVANAAMANAVNTFAGSALVNVASGQNIGDAIKSGLVSGAMAGASTAAFKGGVLGDKQAPAPVVDKSFSVGDTAGTSLDTPSLVGAPSPVTSTLGPDAVSAYSPFPGQQVYPDYTAGIGSLSPASAASSFYDKTFPNIGQSLGMEASATTQQIPTVKTDPTLFDTFKKSASGFMDMVSPSKIQAAGAEQAEAAGKIAYDDVIERAREVAKAEGVEFNPPIATAEAERQAAIKAAMPGALATYGPLAAVGLGAATLGGAFKVPKLPAPDNIDQFKTTGADLLSREPERFGLQFGGVNTTYASNPYARLYEAYQTPRLYAKGGEAYPRKTGAINGPGTGTSDSVPAMLSDGEFVFTAKAVRNMGQGSRRKGAKRMYALMKQLEKKG